MSRSAVARCRCGCRGRANPTRQLVWLAVWAASTLFVTLLVQARLLAPLDEAGLRLVVALRPVHLSEGMNWVFRLGFVQVNAVVALLWAVVLLVRHRSPVAALPPLVLFAAIGIQTGLRLVVSQPAPPAKTYELHREFASQPVGYTLDRADEVARKTLVAATAKPLAQPTPAGSTVPAAAPPAPAPERGSFPSGHATRVLFLALLASDTVRRRPVRWSWLGRRLPLGGLGVIAGLVGYSAMYFGYHWPSDVLAGYLLALAAHQLAAWLRDHPGLSRRGDGPHPRPPFLIWARGERGRG
ncbi:MAG: phosphatase PAP2 family protein [Chloroflexi bacterium]|nr:phosphatase PAP2 family protein [Chloroflexota bacterium]